MATCPNCGVQIAWNAATCPSCLVSFQSEGVGHPIPQSAEEERLIEKRMGQQTSTKATSTIESPRRRQVFLSYAQGDRSVANRIAEALRTAGHPVWFDAWELAPGDSIIDRIDQALAPSDFLVVLLSRRSAESTWVQKELSATLAKELKDRGITVLPALLDDCDLPPLLANRQFVDLRDDLDGGVQRLARQLAALPDIEFSRLDGRQFEQLVADLLAARGFTMQSTPVTRDTGFDFVASYRSRDPFGAERAETWLIEAKFYREQRVSVAALRQMLGYLMTSPAGNKGLVVTNSRMTSVARDFLSELTHKSGHELRVIDGTELTSLVSQHPALVQRYFAPSENQ